MSLSFLLRAATAALMTSLLLGCAGVTVRSADPSDYLAQRRSDMLTTGTLSPATQESLRILGLDLSHCLAEVPRCQHTLTHAVGLFEEQRMAAMAELWVYQARTLQHAARPGLRSTAEVQAWLEAARYAWAYLFFTPRAPGERVFEDRQTQVRDYYNHAVQQAVTGLFTLSAAQDGHIPTHLGHWQLHTDFSHVWLPANKRMPYELIPATSLRFSGLRNQYQRDGIGAELVAVFQTPDEKRHAAAQTEALAGPPPPPFQESLFPALTVVLDFGGSQLQDVLHTHDVQLRAYDPYRLHDIELAGHRVPLAGNFSSGYGLWLARSGFSGQALRTLAGLGQGIVQPTVYLMQPYDPNRHIIVMLHGLASSPEAWINVANEVLGDPSLRQNYQVWQVYYPTNAPLALNNYAIRQALQQTLHHFDPSGQARASQDITLIGHSMGGVLARLMVSDSEGRLMQALETQSALPQDWQTQDKFQHFLEFAPIPQVSSAIFIAAPHRGTDFANNRLARWASNLITLPFSMLGQFDDVMRRLAQSGPSSSDTSVLHIPNSIDNLRDTDPYVRLTAAMPIAPHVRYHSIIGNHTPDVPLPDSSDSIVPYHSAHLPGAQSELVIASRHSVQEHPRAIVEIRRILHEQLQRSAPAP